MIRMTKYYFFGIICLVATMQMEAQSCLPGGITFTSQAQIDAFPGNYPGCTSISGNVTIRSNPANLITNLNGLSTITSIGGYLYIDSNAGLTSLSGLNGLTSIGGGFFVEYNSALTSLTGLNGLTSIAGGLGIFENTALTTLTGLNGVTSINGGIYIQYNSALVNLTGLNGITSIDSYLDISINDVLTSLAGLEGIISIGGDLVIAANPSLTSLASLNGLTSIGGFLAIESNSSLLNLAGLNGLTSIGYLLIDANNALISLSALSGVTTIGGGGIYVYLNSALASLNGLDNIDHTTISDLYLTSSGMLSICDVQSICDYLAIPSNPATIFGNAIGCATRAQVETACLALPVELTHFSARPRTGAIHLSWRTATETANAHFAVEHSRDGSRFREIGRVAGHGTSTEPHDYQFIHENPPPGIHYYRLRQVDLDGSYQYSHTVRVMLEAGGISMYPNPTTGLLEISGSETEDAEFQVSDALGKIVLEGRLQEQTADLSGLPEGLYWISVRTESEVLAKMIVKR